MAKSVHSTHTRPFETRRISRSTSNPIRTLLPVPISHKITRLLADIRRLGTPVSPLPLFDHPGPPLQKTGVTGVTGVVFQYLRVLN